MTAVPDSTDDRDYVRDLIADHDEDPLLTDEQLDRLLRVEGDPRLAAARALDMIAVSEVLVSKKIRTQDLQTDGPAVAAELRSLARALRDEYDAEDGAWDGFDVVDTIPARRRPELSAHEVWGL